MDFKTVAAEIFTNLQETEDFGNWDNNYNVVIPQIPSIIELKKQNVYIDKSSYIFVSKMKKDTAATMNKIFEPKKEEENDHFNYNYYTDSDSSSS